MDSLMGIYGIMLLIVGAISTGLIIYEIHSLMKEHYREPEFPWLSPELMDRFRLALEDGSVAARFAASSIDQAAKTAFTVASIRRTHTEHNYDAKRDIKYDTNTYVLKVVPISDKVIFPIDIKRTIDPYDLD